MIAGQYERPIPRAMTRRRLFLLLASTCGVTGAGAWFVAWRRRLHPDYELLADKLSAQNPLRYRLRELGKRCPDVAQAQSAAQLAHGLFPSANGRRRALAASTEELRALLATMTQRDYAEGRLINAKGWLISRTEGRLAVLAIRP